MRHQLLSLLLSSRSHITLQLHASDCTNGWDGGAYYSIVIYLDVPLKADLCTLVVSSVLPETKTMKEVRRQGKTELRQVTGCYEPQSNDRHILWEDKERCADADLERGSHGLFQWTLLEIFQKSRWKPYEHQSLRMVDWHIFKPVIFQRQLYALRYTKPYAVQKKTKQVFNLYTDKFISC